MMKVTGDDDDICDLGVDNICIYFDVLSAL